MVARTLLAVLLVLLPPALCDAQSAPTKEQYTLTEIVGMLEKRVTPMRVLALVSKSRCVAWTASAGEEAAVHRAGAPGDVEGLLAVLRNWPRCGGIPSKTAAPATPPVGVRARSLGVGFGAEQFALLPPGSFEMGDMNERLIHVVTLSQPFLLQRTEVTQGQWQAVMGTNPSGFPACGATCPVEQVSWEDVQVFLARLNAQDPGKGYRLPTEAEWEYAARVGTTGDYGGTGRLDDMGWYDQNSGGSTHRIGQKRPNARGLYDLHGNVWEWVQDWYGAYSTGPERDPTGPGAGSYRVLRGGSWGNFAGFARSAYRVSYTPSYRNDDVGFRLARTP